MKVKDLRPRSLLESSAVVHTLQQPGCIKKFDVYMCNKKENGNFMDNTSGDGYDWKQEVLMVDVRIGNNLNGHVGIVHGGIISCLLDDAFGWGYNAIQVSMGRTFGGSNYRYGVTANMNIHYRNQLPAESDFVIRVYHDKTRSGGRKVYLDAKVENCTGSVIYVEATALFIQIKSKL